MFKPIILSLIAIISNILASPLLGTEMGSRMNATSVGAFRKAVCRPVFPLHYRVVNPYTFCRSPIDQLLASRPDETIELARLPNQGKYTSRRGECYLLWAPVGPTAGHAMATRRSLWQAGQRLMEQCFPSWNARTAIQEGWIVRENFQKLLSGMARYATL